jgi:hypothetical protein
VREILPDLAVVEEIDGLVSVGGEDLVSDPEIVYAVLELSEETLAEEF